MKEKKINYSESNDIEGGDNCNGLHRKHHSKFLKGKLDADMSIQIKNSGCEVSSALELKKSHRMHRHKDSNAERLMGHLENSKLLKYHSVGDYHNMLPSSKSYGSADRDKASSEMREVYLKEMEILRNKLSLLKGKMVCDGKRMRQRSESEPGFAEVSGGVSKRARDNSPKIKMGPRKLPMSPNPNHTINQISVKHSMPFQRESKSLSPSAIKILEKVHSLIKVEILTKFCYLHSVANQIYK